MDLENKYVMNPLTLRELVAKGTINKSEYHGYSVLLSECYVRKRIYKESISLAELMRFLAVDKKQIKRILDGLVEAKLITYKTSGDMIYYECLLHIDNQGEWQESSGHFEDDGGACFEDSKHTQTPV